MKPGRRDDPTPALSVSAAGTASDAVSPGLRALVTAIFVASGAASLVLQVVWFKQLQFVLGSTTISVSVTVASFFFGLSVGSALGGRLADVVVRPLRTYGLLELALALVSFAVTAFLSNWSVWVGALSPMLSLDSWARLPLMVVLSLASLSLPTILMGATLPLLVRFVTRTRTELANRIGVLYGFNTLGAAIGTLGAGFVLIGFLGVTGSSLVASVAYACVGSLGLVASRREQHLSVPERHQESVLGTRSEARDTSFLIWLFAASGFVSIAYEVVWFRFLTNVSSSSVYAFAGMLSTYLFGLVIGALVCARFLASRKDQLLRYFAMAQLGIAVTATLTLAVLGKASTFHAVLARIVSAVIPDQAQVLLGDDVSFFVTCLVALLLPTTIIGISFPLASELTVMQMRALGRRIGTLYSLNTIGGVLGSLIAGFFLIPYLGSQWALSALILMNVLLFIGAAAAQSRAPQSRLLWRYGAMAGGFVAVSLLVLGPRYLERQLTAFNGATVLELRESREATFAVLEYDDGAAGKYQQLLVNSKSYANNRPEGRRYMAAMAHYPLLLHKGPVETALVICIGTGTTVGAASIHEELRSIDAVDLAPAVFEFARYFVPINHRFQENPRVHKVAADGRHYLLGTHNSFDVITLEPPPPQDAGIVNLYTEEFYQLAKRRLRPGGMLAQWVPLDFARGDLPKMILKAMLAQFKHVSLWVPSRMEGVAIASDDPLQIDDDTLAQRMSAPAVAADLTAIGLRSPEHLLATFVAADERLAAFLADVSSLTDDRPRIEYYNLYPVKPIRVADLKRLREPVERYLTPASSGNLQLDAARAIVDDIWDEHEATANGDATAARSALDAALRLEPNNSYLRFLARNQRIAANQASLQP
ncbi:MAG TPA: fused MFS/spermidine synthase [Stellaceae bacterium]|nr:fused MFS/spermidine synthase [Stellaceae bacterium]